MITKSLWGQPPKRYYSFLNRVEKVFLQRPLKLCILGCADGKFVLPAARKGYHVLGIDIDPIAINGGYKTDLNGKVEMPGLRRRALQEHLDKSIHVVCGDFVEYNFLEQYHAVFTSGAINYSYNLRHDINTVIDKVKSLVVKNGLIYFDYMLPLEEAHQSRPNYFRKGELKSYFNQASWRVLFDKVLPPQLEKAHVDKPEDHYHHWGHLCVQKIK